MSDQSPNGAYLRAVEGRLARVEVQTEKIDELAKKIDQIRDELAQIRGGRTAIVWVLGGIIGAAASQAFNWLKGA